MLLCLNVLLIQFDIYFNPLPHDPDFQQPLERSILKTLREKEKMLVTSISYSHNVFLPVENHTSIFLSHLLYFVCKMLLICISLIFCSFPKQVVLFWRTFLLFLSNLKLSSANSSLQKLKIFHLLKG